jgi:cholestenol delta-isomerase
VGHLYGVALYYGTCGFAEHMRGLSYSRPEAVYYWGYFVGMNAPWVVVPCGESNLGRRVGRGWADEVVVLLWQSGRAIRAAFREVAEGMEGKKAR